MQSAIDIDGVNRIVTISYKTALELREIPLGRLNCPGKSQVNKRNLSLINLFLDF
jgi:hypothetical protein